jgi:hypothetical protein
MCGNRLIDNIQNLHVRGTSAWVWCVRDDSDFDSKNKEENSYVQEKRGGKRKGSGGIVIHRKTRGK